MSLVLSKAFSGLLLSSYVNIKSDLAVKSMKELIENPKIELFYDSLLSFHVKGSKETAQLEQRFNRIPSDTDRSYVYEDKDLNKLVGGAAVIVCQSINCPFYVMFNPHIKLVYTDDHHFYTPSSFRVRKSHPYSSQIYKL